MNGWTPPTAWSSCCGCDAPSVVKIAERSVALRARCGERVGLVVVGAGAYDDNAIEGFTGIPVIGRVPFDPVTASVAAGEAAGNHRLSRSRLVASARSLALTLGGPDRGPEDREASGPLRPWRLAGPHERPPIGVGSDTERHPVFGGPRTGGVAGLGRPASHTISDIGRARPRHPAEAPQVGPSPGEADHGVESTHQQVTR